MRLHAYRRLVRLDVVADEQFACTTPSAITQIRP
jgi:hypothetical protein